MTELAGKAIVVTGAGSGLGAAYARHVAALGANVVVNDVNDEAARACVDEITEAGGSAVAEPADVAKWDTAQRLVEACIAAFGRLDGFVNNAGVLRPALLDQTTEADIRQMIDVNLIGTTACAQAAAVQMKLQGDGGSIVNVASGSQAGDIALGGYGATKAAISSLTFSWAMELRDTGVRINAISPLADTAMAAQNAHLMALQGANRDVHYDALPAPDANAPLVSFLLSDRSRDISGQIIRIAGRQLSFVTHPLIARPVLEADWTFDEIAKAFSDGLAGHQHKLGLAFEAKK
ncbi:SDR family NAD(P)-dependent oxidoreductase [Thalassorhabdomicrobium marinisediminis]|uniref:SDR family NAD(P)-dependent oxidoreductase n=1 Tax=Thalassorhabdomicrobium marinisediminis TaxID=2170577 RepID=UPI002493BAE3|nr:SDR family oxidoreductase [Thalassorhabdomicrobium marinisediminis]